MPHVQRSLPQQNLKSRRDVIRLRTGSGTASRTNREHPRPPRIPYSAVQSEVEQEIIDSAPSAKRPAAYGKTTSSAGLIGGQVPSRDDDGSVVTEPSQHAVIGAARLAAVLTAIEGASGQVVQVGASVGDPARRGRHGDELVQLRGRGTSGEDEDVLLAAQRMVGRQAGDVGGVVERAVAFGADVGGIVLAQAFHAGAAGGGDVGAPFCAAQASAAGIDRDTAVDDGNEVGVGEKVEDGARPGPVDAGENHITVGRGGEPVRLGHTQLVRRRPEVRGGGRAARGAGCEMGLGPVQAHITAGGVQEPVEVDLFDGVEVEQAQVLDAGAGQGFDDEHADRAASDDTDVQTGQVVLGCLSPGGDGAQLPVRGRRRGKEAVIEGDRQAAADHPDALRLGRGVAAGGLLLPDAGAESGIRAREGQTDQRMSGDHLGLRGERRLSLMVNSVQSLPSPAFGVGVDEADAFAAQTLIPPEHHAAYRRLARRPIPFDNVKAFARQAGIAPGIVVGRLQHDGRPAPDPRQQPQTSRPLPPQRPRRGPATVTDHPRKGTVAAPGSPDFALHTLGWRAFQDLCAAVLREVWAQSVHTFADSNDGGRDGAFYGTWQQPPDPIGVQDVPDGPFVLQCKHTKKADTTLTPSELSDEFDKVQALVERGLCGSYVLLTNARVSGTSQATIRQRLRDAGVAYPLILDGQWICDTIATRQRLRTFVPRVYGLGDLSQILDERAYNQAQALLGHLRDELAAFVVTDAYLRAVQAVQAHGFVLLLGEPGVGKSVIAETLAMTALDTWGCLTVKAPDAAGLVRH